MGCNCGKNKGVALKWIVDFNGTSFRFEDGTSSRKEFATVSEANAAIAKAGANGKVRPKGSA